jgi:hypothetical protein
MPPIFPSLPMVPMIPLKNYPAWSALGQNGLVHHERLLEPEIWQWNPPDITRLVSESCSPVSSRVACWKIPHLVRCFFHENRHLLGDFQTSHVWLLDDIFWCQSCHFGPGWITNWDVTTKSFMRTANWGRSRQRPGLVIEPPPPNGRTWTCSKPPMGFLKNPKGKFQGKFPEEIPSSLPEVPWQNK